MPKIDTTTIPTRLTDLEVNEVSYVGKGAIGDTFSIIKSEEEITQNDEEPFVKGDSSDIGITIQNLPDTEFVSMMDQMLVRYNQINKDEGGTDMDRDEIVDLIKSVVTEVVGTSMETVNKNFVSVNKSIDDIQKKFTESPVDDPKKKKTEDEDPNAEVKKAVSEIGGAVKSVAEAVVGITKSLEGMVELQAQVKKMSEETLPGIAQRVETIEKQEATPPAGKEKDEEAVDVQKSASMWPSFTRAGE